MRSSLIDNILKVEARIAEACGRAGRRREEILLVAVTKGVDMSRIREAAEAGLKVFGENRIQEAAEKIRALGPGFRWHMIGHLQSNKAGKAAELGFELIQSVDSVKLAGALARKAAAEGRTQNALLEVNIGGEAQKAGFSPETVLEEFEKVRNIEGLKIKGLMCMGPKKEKEQMRPYFRKANEIWRQMRALDQEADTLSMGMSEDFEAAIEEGATVVRIGTAIFGSRLGP